MEDLAKKLQELNALIKGFLSSQSMVMPSMPKTGPKPLKPAKTPAVPKLPGLAPKSLKDPKKMAEQLKNPPRKAPEMVDISTNGQWTLDKSNYGPKGSGSYTPVHNIDRKRNNTGESVGEGPNTNVKEYTSTVHGTAQSQAEKESKTYSKINRKQPVKHLTGEAAAQYLKSKLNKDEILELYKNGQWSLAKADGSDFRQIPKIDFSLPHVDATNPSLVNANYHGMRGNMNATPEQKSLIHGLDMSEGKGHSKEQAEVYDTKGSKWIHNPVVGKEALVKPHSGVAHGDEKIQGVLGHINTAGHNSARREVMFHNMARDFFGLGHAVPTTAGFTKGGVDYSAQEKVPNAHSLARKDYADEKIPEHVENKHKAALEHLQGSGELHKLGLMDAIMGNNDRHRGNYMLDKDGKKLHLIDNGLSGDYEDIRSPVLPSYIDKAEHGPIHKKAKEWLNKLTPEKAMELWQQYGYSPEDSHVAGFMHRLNNAKEAFKHSNKGYRDTLFDVLKAKDKITPEHYDRTADVSKTKV